VAVGTSAAVTTLPAPRPHLPYLRNRALVVPPQLLTCRVGCLRSVGGTTGAGSHPAALWNSTRRLAKA
jgi:hypothetical protein